MQLRRSCRAAAQKFLVSCRYRCENLNQVLSTTNNSALSVNDRIADALNYHHATKHSKRSLRENLHHPDPSKRPFPFKTYAASRATVLQLDPKVRPTRVDTLSAISQDTPGCAEAVPNLEKVAQLLFLSGGVTRRGGGLANPIYYRAAPCTGALYEIEIYLVCGSLPGCQAGVFHFSPADGRLRLLRDGDFRQVVVEASGNEPAIASAPLIIICTCIYWRNAWRYQERAYRHFGWDNGTLVANLLAACVSLQLPARIVFGFIDAEINHLLDLDPKREVVFSMVAVGRQTQLRTKSEQPVQKLTPLGRQPTAPPSCEINYPRMQELHASSSLHSLEEVRAWRRGMCSLDMATPFDCTFELRPSLSKAIDQESIEDAILRRGSCRQFSREGISFESLSTILDRTTRGIPADFVGRLGAQLNQLYLMVNAVEGLPCGTYVFHRDRGALELLSPGDYRDHAERIALYQRQAADAAVDIFLMADLAVVLQQLGNRGYRAVHFEAGVIGGKLYLGACAQSLGATGLTFMDDAVPQLFSPHAYGKSAIFLLALGKPQKTRADTICSHEVSHDATELGEVWPRILVPSRHPHSDADGSAAVWAQTDGTTLD